MGKRSIVLSAAVAAMLCALPIGMGCDKEEESAPDCGASRTLECDPNCASAQPPQNCATQGSDCGPCDTVGYSCTWLEADVVCECDHRWHCAHNVACNPPAGGYVCD